MPSEGDLTAELSVGTFREFYDVADALTDETILRFDAGGLWYSGVDPANVGMYDAALSADAFDAYEASEGAIGLSLTDLGDLLETAEEDDRLTVETLDHKKVRFTVDGFAYKKAWIEPGSLRNEPDLPDLDLPAILTLPGERFRRAVVRCDAVALHVSMRVEPDPWTFRMTAEGDTATGEFQAAEADGVRFEARGEAWSHYSLDYLKDMVRAIPAGADVTLHVGDEFPLVMEYDFAGGAGEVEYLLAPRIGGSE